MRETMTTVILKIETENNYTEIFEEIPLGNAVFGEDANIVAKYYKRNDETICLHGSCPFEIKCFPRTMTFYCKSNTNDFKIRWFYSKKTNKIHLASGLPQDIAAKYLLRLVNFIKHKINCIASESVDFVLANGLAQATLGVNLYTLVHRLKNIAEVKCVYTPDVSAALKIYTNKGTVCVHSSGKILYMGCKNQQILMDLHQYISSIGKDWEGVPVYNVC